MMENKDMEELKEGWRRVKLSEVLNFYNGKKSLNNLQAGIYKVYGSNGLIGTCNKYLYEKESLIIGRVGAYCGSVMYEKNKFWATDNTIISNLKNQGNLKFYYYLLISINLNKKSSGSAQPLINQTLLNNIEIDLPPLETQEKIASILSSLDDKIEINNEMNKTLEEMAQTLFKRWFIDFDFPNENGEPYRSSGGKMVDSELGEIPEGWRIKEIGEISDIQNGFAFKAPEYTKSGIKVLRTLNIDNNGYFENKNLVFLSEEYSKEKYNKYFFQKFDIALVMVGAGIGKIGMCLENTENSLQNQNMWRFRSKDKKLVPQLYLYFLVIEAQNKAQNWANGSAREFYRKDSFSKINILIPSQKYLKIFDKYCNNVFEKISDNICEIENLTEIRDTLLPKLMSGEIEV